MLVAAAIAAEELRGEGAYFAGRRVILFQFEVVVHLTRIIQLCHHLMPHLTLRYGSPLCVVVILFLPLLDHFHRKSIRANNHRPLPTLHRVFHFIMTLLRS